jgi:hypothetical protein
MRLPICSARSGCSCFSELWLKMQRRCTLSPPFVDGSVTYALAVACRGVHRADGSAFNRVLLHLVRNRPLFRIRRGIVVFWQKMANAAHAARHLRSFGACCSHPSGQWSVMKSTTATIIETYLHVGRERLALRLVAEGNGLRLERTLQDPLQRSQTQVLCITTLRELHEFIKSDPYYPRFRGDFDRVFRRAAELCAKQGRSE